MKKISWGTGITIVIVFFLIFTIVQVLIIHFYVDYDLVERDYYSAEIKYQSQIEKVNRTNELGQSLNIKIDKDFIEFDFPTIFQSDKISGMITFYKPSDDLLDKNQPIMLNKENKMLFVTSQLSTGLWKVKANWQVEEIEYYNEKLIMVP